MNTAIVTGAPLSTWEFMGRDMESAGRLAKALVATGLAPAGMTAAHAFYVMLAGAELGLRGPIEALRHVQVIKGKVAVSAELMRAMMLEQGCEIEWPKLDSTTATIRITRPKGKPQEFTFSKDDAVRAQLWGKGGWSTYPTSMLMARATSLGARAACPDMLRGASYTPEELGAPVTFTDDGAMTYGVTDADVTGDDYLNAAPPEQTSEDSPRLPEEPARVSQAQVKALAILATKKLGGIHRDDRLAMYAAIIEREIASSADLTPTEWRRIVDALNGMSDKIAAHPEPEAVEETDRELWGEPTLAEKVQEIASELGAWRPGKGVAISEKAAVILGLKAKTYALTDLISEGKLDALYALLVETREKKATQAA